MSKPIVLGLVGAAGCGKSTVAQVFSEYGWVELSLAKPIKDMVCTMLGCDMPMLEQLKASNTGVALSNCETAPKLAVRTILQLLGTEFGRNMVHQDLWLWLLQAKIEKLPEFSRVVVSDVRFPNEFQFMKRLGAKFIGILSDQKWSGQARLVGDATYHASELHSDAMVSQCEFVLYNNTTLEDFKANTVQLMEKLL